MFWGILSHARSLGTTQRGGALLLFVLRACCGGMCWPVDRPATHAAAGAAARGALIFCFGDSFTRSGVDGTRGLVFVFLWRLLRCRRGIVSRAREWMARGRLVFVFSLAVAPVSEGDSFTRTIGIPGAAVLKCELLSRCFPAVFPLSVRYKRPCPPTSSQNRPARIRCAAFRNSPPSCAPRLSLNWPPGRSRRFR